MPLQPGDILLNKYRIEALLGQGAFAEVYRVTHLGLDVPRALKVLRRDALGVGSTEFNEFMDRFRLEAQIGAKLNTPTPYPNLLQVHNFEATGDQLVLEMEYASGGSLAERIQEFKEDGKAIPLEDVLKISLDAAEGLTAIHAQDIIHRDLKPSNILFDNRGNAKVADLGLAQIPGGPSMRSKLSVPQSHPGTPGYMSPEQENSLGVLRPPSDIYSLGLVIFEMLTGRNYTFTKPGTRASVLRLEVPQWLVDFLLSMLVEEPKKRSWDGNKTAELLRIGMQEEEKRARQEKNRRKPEPFEKIEREKAKREAAARAIAQREAKENAKHQTREKAARERKPALPITFRWLGIGGIVLLVLILAAYGLTHLPTTIKTTPHPSTPNLTFPLGIGSTMISDKDGMKLVYVPVGSFRMGNDTGNPDEMPVHPIFIDAFWIDQTDITNKIYALCVNASVCKTPANSSSSIRKSYYGNSTYDNYPVIYVNSNMAMTYYEWEKAARSTDGRTYPWGNHAPSNNLLNYNGAVGDTTEVGRYANSASPYGVLDMAGNVWQWVADLYSDTYYANSPTSDPLENYGRYRVLRGGSWYDDIKFVSSTYRDELYPTVTDNNIGFRCARGTSL